MKVSTKAILPLIAKIVANTFSIGVTVRSDKTDEDLMHWSTRLAVHCAMCPDCIDECQHVLLES